MPKQSLQQMIIEYPSLLKTALVERDLLRHKVSLAEKASPYGSEDRMRIIVLQANIEKTKASLESAKAYATQELLLQNPKVTAAAMNVAAQANSNVVTLRRALIDQEEELALFMEQATPQDTPDDLEEQLVRANAEVKAVEAIFEMLKLLASMGVTEVEF